MVSTHLNICSSNWIIFPRIRVKIPKNVWSFTNLAIYVVKQPNQPGYLKQALDSCLPCQNSPRQFPTSNSQGTVQRRVFAFKLRLEPGGGHLYKHWELGSWLRKIIPGQRARNLQVFANFTRIFKSRIDPIKKWLFWEPRLLLFKTGSFTPPVWSLTAGSRLFEIGDEAILESIIFVSGEPFAKLWVCDTWSFPRHPNAS